MGHIKEPLGVDFMVDSTPLTKDDRKKLVLLLLITKQPEKNAFKENNIKEAIE